MTLRRRLRLIKWKLQEIFFPKKFLREAKRFNVEDYIRTSLDGNKTK